MSISFPSDVGKLLGRAKHTNNSIFIFNMMPHFRVEGIITYILIIKKSLEDIHVLKIYFYFAIFVIIHELLLFLI